MSIFAIRPSCTTAEKRCGRVARLRPIGDLRRWRAESGERGGAILTETGTTIMLVAPTFVQDVIAGPGRRAAAPARASHAHLRRHHHSAAAGLAGPARVRGAAAGRVGNDRDRAHHADPQGRPAGVGRTRRRTPVRCPWKSTCGSRTPTSPRRPARPAFAGRGSGPGDRGQ